MKQPQYRGVNELRRMFLEFFESKGHLAMKSFSLVPHNDNSLLLINSGMAPLKPYFTGQEIPPRRRSKSVSLPWTAITRWTKRATAADMAMIFFA